MICLADLARLLLSGRETTHSAIYLIALTSVLALQALQFGQLNAPARRIALATQVLLTFLPFLLVGHMWIAVPGLVAGSALWPRAAPYLWAYAITVGISRVVVLAHFASDVVIGALVGSFGALLVRNAFAARGLVFHVRDGAIAPKPGPSRARLKALVRAVTGR